MKTKLLFLFLICSISKSFAQFGYDQYFDGADSSFSSTSLLVKIDPTPGNIWQVGKPQKVVFDSAATLPNAIVTDTINNYPINNTSSFQFGVRVLGWTHGILGIQWKQKLDMEKKHDGGMVEFSTDHGTSWQSAFNNPHVYNIFGHPASNFDTLVGGGQYAFSGTDSTWEDIWLCFDMTWLSFSTDTIQVRFTFLSDGVNTNQEGWMIDNMNAHITMIHPVKENPSGEYFNVFPNPAKNIINIELKSMHEYHIIENMQLLNSQGKMVMEWNNIPVRYWIDVSKYPSGAYFLKIKSNFKEKTIPVTIQK